ncbi:hypothetical protein G6M87_10890 [Rhizobium rhizogenes]|uniref:hypothetical protein n=1 Tax=Rhizobium rhizogenes TaxID=359 RepID=UPI001572F89D|nr:hypothetical protein [Rhizobium rhizogenes]NTI22363.1 hypothetical protein [Rhizobium rhizogenes]QTG05950.1 hypothetical protein G6M87_10890 [Rhizobium rhizogenes]
MIHFSVKPFRWKLPDGSDIPRKDYIYDIESYPNAFTCTIIHPVTGSVWQFEVSARCNDSSALIAFLFDMQRHGCRLFGFNNYFYDYPVIHHLIDVWRKTGGFTAWNAYEKTDLIINKTHFNDKYRHTVWDNETIVVQGDLLMIHHFDNANKRTGLKSLEFNMRADNVGDLPFEAGTYLTLEQIDTLLRYNFDDVKETTRFYVYSLDAIIFRDELTVSTGMPCLNYNDTKIGKEYFRLELEKALGIPIGKNNRTERKIINIGEVILPYVQFESDEFRRGLDFLKRTSITQTNKPPELKDFSITYGGFQFDIGAGGIHGSVQRQRVIPAADEIMFDIDVSSFYPNLAISNRIFPEHLSEAFCDIYKALYDRRKSIPKSSPINGMLKLALNGVYGDSNQEHSKGFYDPKYTMAITFNGQLLLCMLAERLVKYAGCRLIQINTDGMTVLMKRANQHIFTELCAQWSAMTKLELEQVEYSQMLIANVSAYIAIGADGKIKKRKKDYQWKTDKPTNLNESLVWHQDWSALIVPMAAEMQMVQNVPIRDFIHRHDDAFDFMLKAKAPGKGGRLELDNGTRLQKVTRYAIARHGPGLRTVHRPLAKTPDKERNISIQAGYSVQICDDVRDFDPRNLNHDWYIKEAEKLVI